MQATDTPSEEQEVEMFFEPIKAEQETEADEAPLNETEPGEVETEADASEAEDEKDGEAEEQPEDEAPDEDDELEDDADDDEEQSDGDDEQPDERHAVKVDGEEIQVTLEELKRGYSGQT